MITHFPDEAATADRVIALDKGRIVIDSDAHSALSDVEKLRNYGLDAPLGARIAHELKKHGLDLGGNIITDGELREALCRLR